MVRGTAALAVMLEHVRSLFFVNYSHVLTRNSLVGGAYLLTSLGHQAVLVFFVLSGFFISRSVLDSFRKSRWSWRVFLVNRLTRLLLVLVPGLVLCALWDRVGMILPEASRFYYQAIPNFGTETIAGNSSVSIFVGNLLFLQSIFFPSFGSAKPLWSLSYELWYYMLFPILLLVFVSRLPGAKRLAYAIVGSAIFLMVGRDIALLFLVWLAGAGVGLVHDMRPQFVQRTSAAWYTYCLGAFGLVGLLVVKVRLKEGLASDFMVAASFLPAMYVLVEASSSVVNPAYAALARMLSSFSYSLYVAHLPLLIFIRTCLGHVPRWEFDFKHIVYGVAIASVVAAYSFGISRLTEARTDVVRRALLRHRKTAT
jgi:peptidoglycan/LPS O-acetylase OafA/YrhL